MRLRTIVLAAVACGAAGLAADARAQVTKADYARAQGLRAEWQNLTVDVPDGAAWVGQTARFTFRKTVRGGYQFLVVDAATGQQAAAFDHEKLAAALAKLTGQPATATQLPFS